MQSESLHNACADPISGKVLPPRPGKSRPGWLKALARFFKDDTEERWGGRLIRISNDMMLVCDDNMRILHHNRAFLKGVGYQAGTFVGQSLIEFFTMEDRPEIEETFRHLCTEKTAGARLDGTFVTQRGSRIFDTRIVRSLSNNGRYFFYIVARDETERRKEEQKLAMNSGNKFLDDLPVAAWRTDGELRVSDSCGALWETLGVSETGLLGLDLSNSRCPMTPQFLHQIDYCDTMAGQTLHTSIEWNGEIFDATIDPVLDNDRNVIGTIGMVRHSKNAKVERSIDHLLITQAIRPAGDPKTTRRVPIGKMTACLDVDEYGEDPIALAN